MNNKEAKGFNGLTKEFIDSLTKDQMTSLSMILTAVAERPPISLDIMDLIIERLERIVKENEEKIEGHNRKISELTKRITGQE